MPISSTSKQPKTQPTDPAGLQEQIRSRAYEFYQERNRTEGHDLDDWLQAEAELTATKAQPPLDLDEWVAYDGWHCTEKSGSQRLRNGARGDRSRNVTAPSR